MRYYYTVLVASAQYHGAEALTYSYETPLALRCVVKVPMQKQAVLGIVISRVSKPQFATKQIVTVYDIPSLPVMLLKLIDWIKTYYPAPLGVITQQLLPSDLSLKTLTESMDLSSTTSQPQSDNLPPLTTEQTTVLAHMVTPDTYVLHGDTGTGKTRVYIELALHALTAGSSSLILTPEIGLTSQLATSFRNVFGSRVIVVHSQLTPKARQQTWLQILRSSEPVIVLGPRSALFTPVKKIGLIVVDESHEPAYKQEQAPHYHAVRVASQLAHIHHATVVLGSATPSVTDYYIAEQKHKTILRMTQMATAISRPKITSQLIDLKDRTAFTRSQYLSNALIGAVETSLKKGEQSLLYLNRRGTARVILCNNCGWQAICQHCDLALTYHQDLHILQCHTCGIKQTVLTSCPECGNSDIVFKVVGTKAIEAEVARLFPSARSMRFDTDNKKAERFEQHYEAVQRGEVDILIGTQLLAKGLDLPKLSTLGVVVADTSLTFPDYSAEERTYQLLAQVIGRVGRGHLHDEQIIVQSYDPSRPVITAALNGDFQTFYQSELTERKLFFFPPFCYLLKLTCRRASTKAAEKAVEQFSYTINTLRLPLLIEGPMPSFHTKIGDKYEWQLIIKSKQRSALLTVITALPKSGWNYDIDPINLL